MQMLHTLGSSTSHVYIQIYNKVDGLVTMNKVETTEQILDFTSGLFLICFRLFNELLQRDIF
jgi:hypothetical protein